jgi:hypothetical protein
VVAESHPFRFIGGQEGLLGVTVVASVALAVSFLKRWSVLSRRRPSQVLFFRPDGYAIGYFETDVSESFSWLVCL